MLGSPLDRSSITHFLTQARDGKLTMDDMTGGTFTISNSGIWGSLFGTPIINMPPSRGPWYIWNPGTARCG